MDAAGGSGAQSLASRGPALADTIRETPLVGSEAAGASALAMLREAMAREGGVPGLEVLLARQDVARLIAGTMAGSPYLKMLVVRDPRQLERLLATAPEASLAAAMATGRQAVEVATSVADAMRSLRVLKTEVALLTALADLAGIWPAMRVTQALTETADTALVASVRFLFRDAVRKGDWLDDGSEPERRSGYIVLGLGKYGAGELNYSSDIDIVVFYDLERVRLRAGLEPQPFFVRLTRELVRMMDERTRDGYVFRTDLRLRPDPGATQVALSTEAAAIYYESFGQNWERAALIKARPVAGDLEAGGEMVAELAPFIWRRSLDFAAIADIHAMKRQIHAFRGFGGIGVPGHNVKLGAGGIREIEFFAQTQQLIAGGRQYDLRVRETLAALAALAQRGWIKESVSADLEGAYLFLRRIEHRLQMVADQQTHTMPEAEDELHRFALFAGFPDIDALSAKLIATLETVQRHYARLFSDSPALTSGGANMVFAGEQDDPATLEALARLGFKQPAQVIAGVRGWHHGRYAAVRSPRARELLTEVQPFLIEALADTTDPDLAFVNFDRFLAELPTGVQLFSLLRANPALMKLLAHLMGTAPRLARILSRRRRLLDAVLDPRTLASMPSAVEIDRVIAAELDQAADFQDALDRARVVGSEQIFLIGLKIISGTIDAGQAGGAYAVVAERIIAALAAAVEAELERAHGKLAGAGASVVAMGKLGGREMTAASDLDLIVVYDFDPAVAQSDGPRPSNPIQYFTRFTQRLISALSAPTSEGALYEVDMRLRPSGQKGPVATQLSGFVDYQLKEAWTWEHLALTRARVLTGPPELRDRVEGALSDTLTARRDRAKIVRDVREMRERIFAEKGSTAAWNLKQVRGGLVDLEFIAQHLQLVHAADHPEVLDQNTIAAYEKLAAAGLITPANADTLIAAARLIHNLTQILRLCIEGEFDPEAAPAGLKDLLARAGDAPSFSALDDTLKARQAAVAELFDRLVV